MIFGIVAVLVISIIAIGLVIICRRRRKKNNYIVKATYVQLPSAEYGVSIVL